MKRLKIFWQKSSSWIVTHKVRFFTLSGVLIAGIILIFDFQRGFDWDGILVESHGMLFDIILFGILLTVYEAITEKQRRIQSLKDQLESFRGWYGEEAAFRVWYVISELEKLGNKDVDFSKLHLGKLKMEIIEAEVSKKVHIVCLRDADLRNANLKRAQLQESDLERVQLQKADLRKAQLQKANLQGANLQYANLSEADLSRSNLRKAYLYEVNLEKANLKSADLQGVNLAFSTLAKADLNSTNLEDGHLTRVNLKGAQLQGANLKGAYLDSANLQGAILCRAKLQGVDFSNANLVGADLSHVNLNGGNLFKAELKGANLQVAILETVDLKEANLEEADLRMVSLQKAKLEKTSFKKAIAFENQRKGFSEVMTKEQLKSIIWLENDENYHLDVLNRIKKGLMLGIESTLNEWKFEQGLTKESKHEILTGPKGGKYYLNAKGKKVYLKKK